MTEVMAKVKKIIQVFGPSNTFLVSKARHLKSFEDLFQVRPGGRMHRRMELPAT